MSTFPTSAILNLAAQRRTPLPDAGVDYDLSQTELPMPDYITGSLQSSAPPKPPPAQRKARPRPQAQPTTKGYSPEVQRQIESAWQGSVGKQPAKPGSFAEYSQNYDINRANREFANMAAQRRQKTPIQQVRADATDTSVRRRVVQGPRYPFKTSVEMAQPGGAYYASHDLRQQYANTDPAEAARQYNLATTRPQEPLAPVENTEAELQDGVYLPLGFDYSKTRRAATDYYNFLKGGGSTGQPLLQGIQTGLSSVAGISPDTPLSPYDDKPKQSFVPQALREPGSENAGEVNVREAIERTVAPQVPATVAMLAAGPLGGAAARGLGLTGRGASGLINAVQGGAMGATASAIDEYNRGTLTTDPTGAATNIFKSTVGNAIGGGLGGIGKGAIQGAALGAAGTAAGKAITGQPLYNQDDPYGSAFEYLLNTGMGALAGRQNAVAFGAKPNALPAETSIKTSQPYKQVAVKAQPKGAIVKTPETLPTTGEFNLALDGLGLTEQVDAQLMAGATDQQVAQSINPSRQQSIDDARMALNDIETAISELLDSGANPDLLKMLYAARNSDLERIQRLEDPNVPDAEVLGVPPKDYSQTPEDFDPGVDLTESDPRRPKIVDLEASRDNIAEPPLQSSVKPGKVTREISRLEKLEAENKLTPGGRKRLESLRAEKSEGQNVPGRAVVSDNAVESTPKVQRPAGEAPGVGSSPQGNVPLSVARNDSSAPPNVRAGRSNTVKLAKPVAAKQPAIDPNAVLDRLVEHWGGDRGALDQMGYINPTGLDDVITTGEWDALKDAGFVVKSEGGYLLDDEKIRSGARSPSAPDPAPTSGRSAGYKYSPLDVSKSVDKKVFYHGTKGSFDTLSNADPDVLSAKSLYGPGIYLTDNPDVAAGYAKTKGKGPEGRVLQTQLKDIKLLDLEQPVSPEVRSAIEQAIGYGLEGKTGRELIDDLKSALDDGMTPMSEAEDVYNAMHANLSKLGYYGLRHEGGRYQGKDYGPHNVAILFPENSFYKGDVRISDMLYSGAERQALENASKPSAPAPGKDYRHPYTDFEDAIDASPLRDQLIKAIEESGLGFNELMAIFNKGPKSAADPRITANLGPKDLSRYKKLRDNKVVGKELQRIFNETERKGALPADKDQRRVDSANKILSTSEADQAAARDVAMENARKYGSFEDWIGSIKKLWRQSDYYGVRDPIHKALKMPKLALSDQATLGKLRELYAQAHTNPNTPDYTGKAVPESIADLAPQRKAAAEENMRGRGMDEEQIKEAMNPPNAKPAIKEGYDYAKYNKQKADEALQRAREKFKNVGKKYMGAGGPQDFYEISADLFDYAKHKIAEFAGNFVGFSDHIMETYGPFFRDPEELRSHMKDVYRRAIELHNEENEAQGFSERLKDDLPKTGKQKPVRSKSPKKPTAAAKAVAAPPSAPLTTGEQRALKAPATGPEGETPPLPGLGDGTTPLLPGVTNQESFKGGRPAAELPNLSVARRAEIDRQQFEASQQGLDEPISAEEPGAPLDFYLDPDYDLKAAQSNKVGVGQAVAEWQRAGMLLVGGLKDTLSNFANIVSQESSRAFQGAVDKRIAKKTGVRTAQGYDAKSIGNSLTAAGEAFRQMLNRPPTAEQLKRLELQPIETGIKFVDKFVNFTHGYRSALDNLGYQYAFRRSMEEQIYLEYKNKKNDAGEAKFSEDEVRAKIDNEMKAFEHHLARQKAADAYQQKKATYAQTLEVFRNNPVTKAQAKRFRDMAIMATTDAETATLNNSNPVSDFAAKAKGKLYGVKKNYDEKRAQVEKQLKRAEDKGDTAEVSRLKSDLNAMVEPSKAKQYGGQALGFLFDYHVPFARANINSIARVFELTVGAYGKGVGALVKRAMKGWTPESQKQIGKALGDGATGLGLMMIGAGLAASGLLRRYFMYDETDPEAKGAAIANQTSDIYNGSVNFGGISWDLKDIGSIGRVILMGGAVTQGAMDKGAVSGATTFFRQQAQNVLDNPYLQGGAKAIKTGLSLKNENPTAAKRELAQLPSKLVPNLKPLYGLSNLFGVPSLERAPERASIDLGKSTLQNFADKWPFIREFASEPKLDPLGRETPVYPGQGLFNIGPTNQGPLFDELQRTGISGVEYKPGETMAEYNKRLKRIGPITGKSLTGAFRSPYYKRAKPEIQDEMRKRIITGARKGDSSFPYSDAADPYELYYNIMDGLAEKRLEERE